MQLFHWTEQSTPEIPFQFVWLKHAATNKVVAVVVSLLAARALDLHLIDNSTAVDLRPAKMDLVVDLEEAMEVVVVASE